MIVTTYSRMIRIDHQQSLTAQVRRIAPSVYRLLEQGETVSMPIAFEQSAIRKMTVPFPSEGPVIASSEVHHAV